MLMVLNAIDGNDSTLLFNLIPTDSVVYIHFKLKVSNCLLLTQLKWQVTLAVVKKETRLRMNALEKRKIDPECHALTKSGHPNIRSHMFF